MDVDKKRLFICDYIKNNIDFSKSGKKHILEIIRDNNETNLIQTNDRPKKSQVNTRLLSDVTINQIYNYIQEEY